MRTIYFIREKKNKFGGAETYLARLSDALDEYSIDHQIINSIFPKFLPSWLRVIIFNVQVCLIKKERFYFSLERIVCPDIYRAGDGVHNVFLRIQQKSKINLLHPIYLFLEKQCFNKAKHIIANSEMVKNEIIDTYNIDSKKISVIYNGIRLKKFDYRRSFDKLSDEFSISKNHKILLYVGSGFKRKGVEEFLQIIAKLRNSNIQAFILGKEKNIKYYQDLTYNLNISNQVIFTGPRDDVDDFYTISDIFLFPTRYEPFSNVVLEAMSFENVVFTTRQNGASEILDGEFIMSNSMDLSVVNKIEKLLKDKKLLKTVKKRNKYKSKQFSIEKNLSETLKVIDEVVN